MVKKTLDKLDDILERIRTHPEYSGLVRVEYAEHLRRDADKHSCSMEKEDQMNGTKRDYKKCKQECYGNLEEARVFLGSEGISQYSLSQLGHLIEPVKDGVETPKGFRTTDVQFGEFAATDPLKIQYGIESLIAFLNEDKTFHPVIRATEAHLQMVMTHPYPDGNGRAARLLQNFCLEQRAYPPAIILDSEREPYIGILNKALGGRISKKNSIYEPTSEDNLFQNFIASKVLLSAEKLEKRLKKKRIYEVSFDKIDKPLIFTLKKSFRGLGRKKGKEVLVSLKKDNRKNSFLIQGDLGKEEINSFLIQQLKKHVFLHYEVRSITH